METVRLQQFCYIVETGSMSKACELSGISLSGLSKSMKILQVELSLDLLIQQGRGVQVTKEGELFYQKALGVLEAVKNLSVKKENERKVIKIGLNEIFTFNLFEDVFNLQDFTVEWHQLNSGELEKSILEGVIDFGLTYKPVPQNGITHKKLGNFSFGIFVRNSYYQKIKNIQIVKPEFVYPISGLPLDPNDLKNKKFWYKEFEKQIVKRRVSSLHLGVSSALENDLAIFLPHFLVKKLNTRHLKDFHFHEIKIKGNEEKMSRELYLVKSSQEKSIINLESVLHNVELGFLK